MKFLFELVVSLDFIVRDVILEHEEVLDDRVLLDVGALVHQKAERLELRNLVRVELGGDHAHNWLVKDDRVEGRSGRDLARFVLFIIGCDELYVREMVRFVIVPELDACYGVALFYASRYAICLLPSSAMEPHRLPVS